jgi:hypothetical protein
MATDQHRLALERSHGREEGEAFDRRLREAERAEREERLSRIAWGGEGWCEPGPTFPEIMALHAALDARAAEALTPGEGPAPAAMAPLAPGDEAISADRPHLPHLPLPRFVLPTLPLDLAEPGRRAPALNELQLRREVERLSHFHDSVQQSRAWRLTQSLRRLVGRAW